MYWILILLITEKNDTQSGKLRVAGSASALDYVYLNVRNLDEAEEGKDNHEFLNTRWIQNLHKFS